MQLSQWTDTLRQHLNQNLSYPIADTVNNATPFPVICLECAPPHFHFFYRMGGTFEVQLVTVYDDIQSDFFYLHNLRQCFQKPLARSHCSLKEIKMNRKSDKKIRYISLMYQYFMRFS